MVNGRPDYLITKIDDVYTIKELKSFLGFKYYSRIKDMFDCTAFFMTQERAEFYVKSLIKDKKIKEEIVRRYYISPPYTAADIAKILVDKFK